MTENVVIEEGLPRGDREAFSADLLYLEAMLRNALLAERILVEVSDGYREAAVHIVRAWQALVEFNDFRPEQSKLAEAVGSLELEEKDFVSGLARAALEDEIRWLQNLSVGVVVDQSEPDSGCREKLERNCAVLFRVEKRIRRKLYQDYGIVTAPALFLRYALAVCLLAAAGYGVYLVARTPGPWRVFFYSNTDLQGESVKKAEFASANHDWTSKKPLAGVHDGSFSARFFSCLILEKPATVLFALGSDDGTRLLVDQDQVIDLWSPHGYLREEGQRTLPAGVHRLQVDFFDIGGAAIVDLDIQVDGKDISDVPEGYLKYPDDVPGGSVACSSG